MNGKLEESERSAAAARLNNDFLPWVGSLGGAVLWLLHLIGAYLISEFGCASGWGESSWLGVGVVSWMGLGLSACVLTGAVLCQRITSRGDRRYRESSGVEPVAANAGRAFLMRSGLLANRIFMLIIAVQTIPFLFYLQGC